MWWVFLIPIVVLILGAIIKACGTTPSQELNNKFIALETLTGKTYPEIVNVVGEPNSKDRIGDTILCQWIQPAYHIGLLFDSEMICLGVNNETKIDESLL